MSENDTDYILQKKTSPQDNYQASMERAQRESSDKPINNINKQKNNSKETQKKVKIILYKNGFVLNNGPFRDLNTTENKIFLADAEKGLIPDELKKRGIDKNSLVIENRRNVIYSKKFVNPISSTLKAFIDGEKNANISNNNQGINIKINENNNNLPKNVKIDPNITIRPPIILKPGEDINIEQLTKQYLNPYFQSQQFNYDSGNNLCLTPIREHGRKNFVEENQENEGFGFKRKVSKSVPKNNNEVKFKTFASLLREEKEKEEKKQNKNSNNNNEEIEEEKKFTAFTGSGKVIGNVNIEGLRVDKNIKNVVDKNSPISKFSIRLFNGEVIKCEFNHSQSLRDIYFYVQTISGSNNFHLLDGFPPKPLRDYDKKIGDLNIENSILTQKIK